MCNTFLECCRGNLLGEFYFNRHLNCTLIASGFQET
ncbi:hypothetical protein Nmel_003964 [Mimus melanotis]